MTSFIYVLYCMCEQKHVNNLFHIKIMGDKISPMSFKIAFTRIFIPHSKKSLTLVRLQRIVMKQTISIAYKLTAVLQRPVFEKYSSYHIQFYPLEFVTEMSRFQN